MDEPPETPRRSSSYTMHGETIEDPYLWLEEPSDEVDAWIDAQNAYAESFLDTVDIRDELAPRFESYARTTDYGIPIARPTGYFQAIERPEHDQPVLTFRQELDGERTVILDPNEWADDGTTSMGWWHPSPDGDRLAYAVDECGEEQFDVVVVEVPGGDIVDELTALGRSMQVAWTDDGVYYGETGAAEAGAQLEKAVRYHRFGTEQADDVVLRETTEPSRWPAPITDRDGRHLIIAESVDWERTELWYAPVGETDLEPLLVDTDAVFHPLLHDGRLYLRSNLDADRYRLLACDLDTIDRPLDPADLTEVVPEEAGILQGVTATESSLLARYQRDVVSEVKVVDPDGTITGAVTLPGTGTVTGLAGNRDAPEAFLSYESFDHPPAVFHVDPMTGSTDELDRTDLTLGFEVTVDQRWVTSADGTEVPMFVVHRRGLEGPAPTLLYGYGGYENSLTPGFLTFGQEFLRAGGVFVMANLRGGGEFGKRWHEAARHERKQRTFDDMIAAAEALIDDGTTTADRLAIRGGSNGGLTVGAVMTQRPDLVAAVVCGVPLLDMLRFHRFLLGDSWTSEYGSPEDPEAFEWIRAYSPYHNLEPRPYPDVLFTTAEGDTRVHPVHAWKMAARMQHLAEDTLVLCKTNRDTGHGTGKPTWMVVEEALDVWGFVFDRLGIDELPTA